MVINKQGVGIIIQNQNNEFLLHLRDSNPKYMPNQWCLIGGAKEPNETLEETATREIKEEIGLDVLDLKFFKNTKLDSDWDISIYVAKVNTEKQKPTLTEGKEIRFISVDKVTDLLKSLDYSNPYLESLNNYIQTI